MHDRYVLRLCGCCRAPLAATSTRVLALRCPAGSGDVPQATLRVIVGGQPACPADAVRAEARLDAERWFKQGVRSGACSW